MHRTIAIVAVTCSLFLTAGNACAEVFVDLYAGKNKTDNGKADINFGPNVSVDVKYDSSFTAGGRVGGWIGKYFGLGVDIFHFNTDEKDSPVEQGNLAFALDLMARLPLFVGEGMPNGRLPIYKKYWALR
jgi:hypothetical protein